jgi:hypothetical protein
VVRGVSRCAAARRVLKKVARGVENRSWGIVGGLDTRRGDGLFDARRALRSGPVGPLLACAAGMNADKRGWHQGGGCAAGTARPPAGALPKRERGE